MKPPIYQPYIGGKGGVDIGLKPIEEKAWLEVDDKFNEEILLKKNLYKHRKAEVFISSHVSRNIQQDTLNKILGYMDKFYPSSYNIQSEYVEVFQSGDVYKYNDFENPLELASLIVQEDLVLMHPEENVFKLEAASLCAPTRWSLQEKFQQSLSDIHAGVPGYKQKIDSRVNKIFLNLPPNRIFERFNWSIFDSPKLFQPISSKSLVEIENIEPESLYLRVERQTIRLLDNHKTVLFTVRVHSDPITSILNNKQSIIDLLKAIQNLDDDMKNYKVIKPFESNLKQWLKSKIEHE